MSDAANELKKLLDQASLKHTYFLLAVAASAIALSVQRTTGMAMTWRMIPLGLAVLAWGVSFFAGCREARDSLSALYGNALFYQFREGSHRDTPIDPGARRAKCDRVYRATEKKMLAAAAWSKAQFRLLILGGLLFLVWHVMEMAPASERGGEARPKKEAAAKWTRARLARGEAEARPHFLLPESSL